MSNQLTIKNGQTPLGPPRRKLPSTNPVQIMNSVDNPWNSSVEVNLI